ncbi:MAG TPA: DoxX family protein [Gammaproteobacteria bacterium]|nr:DoxX family protein [Gammaproteobacteria bacterium]
MSLVEKLRQPVAKSNNVLAWFSWALLLYFRCHVAWVFLNSGWWKLTNWETNLTLFEYEYQVPLLPYEMAAYLATFGELVFPVFLVFGLGTRYAAVLIQFVNVMAVVSYYSTLSKGAGLALHQLYGAMLLTCMVYGGGLISLDHWLKVKFARLERAAG